MDPIIDGLITNLKKIHEIYVITVITIEDHPFEDNKGLSYYFLPNYQMEDTKFFGRIEQAYEFLEGIAEKSNGHLTGWESWIDKEHFTCPAQSELVKRTLLHKLNKSPHACFIYRLNLKTIIFVDRKPLSLL